MGTEFLNSPISDTNPHRRRVLVCLDHSRFSEACVPYAVALAKAFGGAITLTHVMQPHQVRTGPQASDALGWEISRQEAQGYLERWEREASQAFGHAIDVRLEQGHPAERIVELARELSADLTVLGSHGEAASTQWSLGSTVQQVLALSRGSVFVVHSSTPMASSLASPARILVPLDGSLRSESVLPTAVRVAETFGAELLLVHVVQEPLTSSVLYSVEDLELARTLAAHLEISARAYLERLAQTLTPPDTTTVRTLVVRHASPHQCLLDMSQDENADLIVVSAHGSTCDSARSFGNVTASLLTHSKGPVLVLQDLPECGPYRADRSDSTAPPPPLRASYAPENA